jgi:hypothetical protein
MKRICYIIIILISHFSLAQNSRNFFFDYTNYSITNTQKLQNKSIESFLINDSFFLQYQNISKNKLSTNDFDINQNESVKKISVFDKNIHKTKLFEIDFFENGKIKTLKSEKLVYTFEYRDTLEIRRAISNGFESNIDSIFFNKKGNIIKLIKHSRNSFNEAFESERINNFYDELDRVIIQFRIKNIGLSKDKVSYFREISKFNYCKDSIIEKIYSNRDNNILLNDEKDIFNDTIKLKSDFKKTHILDNRNRIIKIIYKISNKDNSESILKYFITYNSDNKITSLKRDDNLFYHFDFKSNGLLKTTLFVPDNMIDYYEYNKKDDLIKRNKDTYSYEYDKFGNWIEYKIKYENYNSHQIREIEYY